MQNGVGPHTIEIEIDLNTGALKSTVKGLKGKSCTIASKWVDNLGTVTRDEHTPEYWEEPKRSITVGTNKRG
jgi:hypothetical protein